jgi:transcriptional regulator with XRE-family HTH domain
VGSSGNADEVSTPSVPRDAAAYVARRVTELRQSKGWSRYRLALEAELSEGYLGQFEKGKYDPTLTTLLKLTSALDLYSVEELLGGALLGSAQARQATGVRPPRLPET